MTKPTHTVAKTEKGTAVHVDTSKVRVLCVVSFESVRRGDEGSIELTPRIKALIDNGYLRTTEDVSLDGAGQREPGGDSDAESTGSNAGDLDGSPAGVEPSEGSDAG